MKYSRFIKPMLAKLADEPFSSNEWIFEIKLDGYRAIAELDRKNVKLYSRNGLAFEGSYPVVVDSLKKLKMRAIFDGEVVALDATGRSQFQLLQQIGDNPSFQLVYYVFDLLELNGKNLMQLPLINRKELLQSVIPKNEIIRYSDHIEKEGKKFYKLMVKKNLEGMIAKKSESIYVPGSRSSEWLKIKNHYEQEVIIAGFTKPKGSRTYFGSLVLAVYDDRKLTYVGNAGTGFNEKTLKSVYEAMKGYIKSESPFIRRIPGMPDVTWLKPVLVANVKFSEWTQDGQMRHPVFLGLRKDKAAGEVTREI